MDNMETRIMDILQNPEQMEQIMQIARNLGLGPELASAEPEAPDISILTKLLQSGGQQDTNRNALLSALLPYLKPDRQRRLEKAMQLARFSSIAEAALQSFRETSEGG